MKRFLPYQWTCLVAQMVKPLSTVREIRVQSLGWEDPLGKETATCSRRNVTAISDAWPLSVNESSPKGTQCLRCSRYCHPHHDC